MEIRVLGPLDVVDDLGRLVAVRGARLTGLLTNLETHAARLEQVATRLAALRGLADPSGHARSVSGAFLPDVLRLRPGQPARYQPGTGNGGTLHDDAFGVALTILNGSPLGVTPSPHPVVPDFPHLPRANHDDLPALAELFGLRPLDPSGAAASAMAHG